MNQLNSTSGIILFLQSRDCFFFFQKLIRAMKRGEVLSEQSQSTGPTYVKWSPAQPSLPGLISGYYRFHVRILCRKSGLKCWKGFFMYVFPPRGGTRSRLSKSPCRRCHCHAMTTPPPAPEEQSFGEHDHLKPDHTPTNLLCQATKVRLPHGTS